MGGISPTTPRGPFTRQCGITLITWVGGSVRTLPAKEPYSMVVLKDNEIVESFKNIPQTNVNQTDFTWLTNIAAGQQVRIEIFDQIGAVAPTGLFTIQPGTSNCSLII
ncbi:uncharacterized protein TRAVEDRAFT_24765 [Trametes versicolor FP-101664 SS1]|uniref:Uncharacterized protein n=1 Tax=Trametes versicolor (strain FP-101664) TaxID=717944 RepID=R7S7W4_TRAVS|nr:uncharacterized protein TRAVEDRAFT_24765 [Trametes versicolor FP-101664 SS1]EIW52081.1 hypothetical protein TRAVEDRAFT_24765 [Trametes versicolor FP-101664 SS1]